MSSINLTGYKLTFDDEFNARSISQTGAGTTWADIRSEWRYDAKQSDASGNSISSSIDYIRAYSSDPNAVAVKQDTVSSPDGHDPGLYGAVVGSSLVTYVCSTTSISTDAHAYDIARLCYGLLDRAPDAGGLQSWITAITTGSISLHDVAQAMLGSAEYASLNGSVSDSTYVQDLYQDV